MAYKSMLVERSGYFEAACHEHWESGRTRVITLEDQEPDIVAIFVAWVLTGSVKSSAKLIELPAAEQEAARKVASHEQWMQLAKCYVLGDYLQAPGLQNAVIDLLLQNMQLAYDELKTIEHIEYVFANTTAGSPLRSIILEAMSSQCPDPHVRNEEYLWDLAHMVMEKYNNGTPKEPPWKKVRCHFHKHPDQSEGYICKKFNNASKNNNGLLHPSVKLQHTNII